MKTTLDEWQKKIISLETNLNEKTDENHDLLMKIEALEIKISNYEFEGQRHENVKRSAMKGENDISRLKKQLEEWIENYKTLETIKIKSDEKLNTLENKITLLMTEIERLKTINNSISSERDSLKSRCENLEENMKDFKNYEEKIIIMTREIEKLYGSKVICDKENAEYKKKIIKLEENNASSEGKMMILAAEIERLAAILKENEKV